MASGWHAGHRDAVLSYWASSWLTRDSLGRRAEDRFCRGFCDPDAASFEQCDVPPLTTSTACAHRPTSATLILLGVPDGPFTATTVRRCGSRHLGGKPAKPAPPLRCGHDGCLRCLELPRSRARRRGMALPDN